MVLMRLPPVDNHQTIGDWCQPLPPFTTSTGLYMYPADFPEYQGKAWPIVLVTTSNPTATRWPAASQTVFSRMFGKVNNSGNYLEGGLGVSPVKFFDNHYQMGTLGPSDLGRVPNPRSYVSSKYTWLKACNWK